MQRDHLEQLVQRLLSGEMRPAEFLDAVAPQRSIALGHTTLDVDRPRRCGFPEVVYGEGKSVEVLRDIFTQLLQRGHEVLATRIDADKAQQLRNWFPTARYNLTARTIRIAPREYRPPQPVGYVPIVTAGTTDLPVAEEARETVDWMGVRTAAVHDIGVAGPHRLQENLDRLQGADAIVVVAGLEGALPSVVGGHVACPVVAVPTSVGYGASFGGVAALLGMLNSCASNVVVVNIDAGFKAGYVAGLIARSKWAAAGDRR